jgi:hypothetical protein
MIRATPHSAFIAVPCRVMDSVLAAIRPTALVLNGLILVVGGYYVTQGFFIPATGAILGAFNLLTLTRLGEQGPTRFIALVPAVLCVMGGAMGLGIAAALLGRAPSDEMPHPTARAVTFAIPAVCYFLGGTLTLLWVLLLSLGQVPDPNRLDQPSPLETRR